MYEEAKRYVKRRGYASVSELIRDAVRDWLYPRITDNGFTPKFENGVLEAEKEANAGNVVEWNGKGSFTDFVLKHPIKSHGAR
jgi:Arc/MetJ-type ribon-helix-helix transcriptional regulator